MSVEDTKQRLLREHAHRRAQAHPPLPSEADRGAGLGAWFLGPKAENAELLARLVQRAITDHARGRRDCYPQDPEWLTPERKAQQGFKRAVAALEREFDRLLLELDGSVPFFSYRYQAHMLWDVTLPSVLGYFAALLYNQNNVAAEASPVTTFYEMQVGRELCQLLGFDEASRPWGHITCDGSIANNEALWAARNLKYYPLGMAAALAREPALHNARDLSVPLPRGGEGVLRDLDPWQLLNLKADDVLALPERLQRDYDVPPGLDALLKPYTLQELGLLEFHQRFSRGSHDPVLLAPATMHYSWPKGAALLGLGAGQTLPVQVDRNARMDLRDLRRKLDLCLRTRRPVLMVVAVVGSTVEGAVDPLDDILNERERYRKLGLEFWVHVDGAWGGYFATMLRPPAGDTPAAASDDPEVRHPGPEVALNEHVECQLRAFSRADSITVDPHKSGFIPYPAGGLCYRNSAMRHLIAFTAPVVYKGDVDPTVGVFGIEGSKPGAAAAATYLSHRVIGLHRDGYGRILSRCMFNSKRLYAALVTMAKDHDPFRIVPVQRLPIERALERASEAALQQELADIAQDFVAPDNDALVAALKHNETLRSRFRNLGSDQLIIACAFNFRYRGRLNRQVGAMNRLNSEIFERLSILKHKSELPKTPLFVTCSELDPGTHGPQLVDDFKARLGVVGDPEARISVLVFTTMDPWLTDTGDGNIVPTLVNELREEVLKIIGASAPFGKFEREHGAS